MKKFLLPLTGIMLSAATLQSAATDPAVPPRLDAGTGSATTTAAEHGSVVGGDGLSSRPLALPGTYEVRGREEPAPADLSLAAA